MKVSFRLYGMLGSIGCDIYLDSWLCGLVYVCVMIVVVLFGVWLISSVVMFVMFVKVSLMCVVVVLEMCVVVVSGVVLKWLWFLLVGVFVSVSVGMCVLLVKCVSGLLFGSCSSVLVLVLLLFVKYVIGVVCCVV